MSDGDDFTPKLGKIRALGSKRAKSYVKKVLRAVARSGGKPHRGRARYSGVRSGRGAGIGRVLARRDRFGASRNRRVVVKARFTRLKGGGLDGARAHLRYIQRDGVRHDGSPGELYGRDVDHIDGKGFLERCEDDRHQFRFIVAVEDGDHYDDLKPVIRRLMGRMEEDLQTKFDWVAVDHHNTGHPHTHIVLRGKTERGDDLVIARDYISQGIRERASEIVTFDLGLRTDQEIEQRLMRDMEQERFTSVDRELIATKERTGHVQPLAQARDSFDRALRSGRLQKLARLGLAAETVPGAWTIVPDLEARLRALGLRGDIIKTMHLELTEKGLTRPAANHAIYDPSAVPARTLTGRVIAKGLSDEITDRQYLMIDGTDGYTHYVDIGLPSDQEQIGEGHIVAIRPKEIAVKAVDETVAEIAAANGGRYDLDTHLRHDPTATVDFAETHIRRLEAIRKLTGGVERTPEGTWLVATDHVERAKAYELARARQAPVVTQILSRLDLETQIAADGATWLDKALTESHPIPLREQGFGRDAARALTQRRQWLVEQQLAQQDGAETVYRANLLAVLRRRELVRVGAQLAEELGLSYVEPGKHIEGIYRKPVNLVSGRYAMIESRGREFSLVPWRSVLDRSLGREVSGIARGDNISWTIGRTRGLGR